MDSNINCGTCEHWQKNSHKKRGKCMMSTEKNPLMQVKAFSCPMCRRIFER